MSAAYALLIILVGASIPVSASPPREGGDDPMTGHRQLAEQARLRPCSVADLDCRAFTGALA